MKLLPALLLLLAPSFQDRDSWEDLVALGKRNLAALRDLRAALPRAEFDPGDLARLLGGDVDKAVALVSERVGHESYRGFMKGAQGALVSRRANTADRALLLAALLESRQPRLVRGTLPPGKRFPWPSTPSKDLPPTPQTVADAAARFKVDPAALQARVEQSVAEDSKFREALKARVERDRAAISGALQAAEVPLPAGAVEDGEVWWVRVGERDLLKPDGAVENAVHVPAELPADRFHRLRIRMRVGGGGEETSVLDVAFRAADLFGRALTIRNAPMDDPGRLGRVKAPTMAAQLDAMAATAVFVPFLAGGPKPVTGHPFDLEGKKLPVREGVVGKLGGGKGLFDDLGAGAKKRELQSCRLEVELTAPGAAPVRVVRSIYAGGKGGRQRVFDLLSSRELLVLPGELSSGFVLDRLLEADIAQKDLLLSRLAKPSLAPANGFPRRTPPELFEFALARGPALRDLGIEVSAPAPLLVSFVRRIVDGAPARLRMGIDILSNSAEAGAAPSWKESAALAAGLLDAALEHEVLKTVPGEHANASVRLEAAKEAPKVERMGGDVARVRIGGASGAWYDVDSRTGSCLGYMEEGGGQDMADYTTLLANWIEEIKKWQDYAERMEAALACAMKAIDALDPERAFAGCILGVGIREVFGWSAGRVLDRAARGAGGGVERVGGMAVEDMMKKAVERAFEAGRPR